MKFNMAKIKCVFYMILVSRQKVSVTRVTGKIKRNIYFLFVRKNMFLHPTTLSFVKSRVVTLNALI